MEPKNAPEVEAWREHLSLYLQAAGGIDGTERVKPTFELPTPRSEGDFRIAPSFTERKAYYEQFVAAQPQKVIDTTTSE